MRRKRRSKTTGGSCAVLRARIKSAKTKTARGKALGQAMKNHCYKRKRTSRSRKR
jgi:hypothetical protein